MHSDSVLMSEHIFLHLEGFHKYHSHSNAETSPHYSSVVNNEQS